MEQLNVILANDHSILRSGLKASLLYGVPSLKILAEPENFPQVFSALNTYPQTVVLVTDDVMPGGNVGDALALIREQFSNLKVIVTTMHADVDYIKSLVPLCDGVVSYINASQECARAIEVVMNGGIYFTFPGLGKTGSLRNVE